MATRAREVPHDIPITPSGITPPCPLSSEPLGKAQLMYMSPVSPIEPYAHPHRPKTWESNHRRVSSVDHGENCSSTFNHAEEHFKLQQNMQPLQHRDFASAPPEFPSPHSEFRHPTTDCGPPAAQWLEPYTQQSGLGQQMMGHLQQNPHHDPHNNHLQFPVAGEKPHGLSSTFSSSSSQSGFAAFGAPREQSGFTDFEHAPNIGYQYGPALDCGLSSIDTSMQLTLTYELVDEHLNGIVSNLVCSVEIFVETSWILLGETGFMPSATKLLQTLHAIRVPDQPQRSSLLRFAVNCVDATGTRKMIVCFSRWLHDIVADGKLTVKYKRNDQLNSIGALGRIVINCSRQRGRPKSSLLTLKMSADNLPCKSRMLGRSEIYVGIVAENQSIDSAAFVPQLTKAVPSCSNPEWEPLQLRLDLSNRSNRTMVLRLSLHERDRKSTHLVGKSSCSLDRLVPGQILPLVLEASSQGTSSRISRAQSKQTDLKILSVEIDNTY